MDVSVLPDEQVGVVDRGRGYLDDHLPCLWRGNFDLVQLHHLLRAEAVDLDGLHLRHFALLVPLATLLEANSGSTTVAPTWLEHLWPRRRAGAAFSMRPGSAARSSN